MATVPSSTYLHPDFAGRVRHVREMLHRNREFLPEGWKPHVKQILFLALGAREALYGGAAGGGKSEAALAGAAMYLHVPFYSAGLFRWTYQDLALPGALMDRAHSWWNKKAHWNGTDKTFTFPSKATCTFGYLKNPLDHLRYQGAEFQFTGFDELTQLREHQYRYVGLSRVRRIGSMPVPLRTWGFSNPGGPGHVWVGKRFVSGDLPFVPARIADNPTLDAESYVAGLEGLDSVTKAQLLAGDWTARERGDYFRREWFGPMLQHGLDPTWSVRIRWWDLAATQRDEDEKGKRPRTAGVKVAKDSHGQFAVEHALAFSRTPGARDALILQTAQADGYACVVGLEEEPGSGGIAQCETLRKKLRAEGYRVVIEKATASKEERADPVASELEIGAHEAWRRRDDHDIEHPRGVRIVAGPWTEDYLDEVEQFPDGERLDLADATASAFNWLRTKPIGFAPAVTGDDAQIVVPVGILPEDIDVEPEDMKPDRLLGLGTAARYHRSSRDRIKRRRW